MARYFLDSSALVKRYHHEHGSPDVHLLFNAPENRLVISRLALVELASCLARLVREGVLTDVGFGSLMLRVEADVAVGLLAVAAVSAPRLEEAAELLATHGLTLNVRTLDALHLATAQALNRRNRITGFVAADDKLLKAAASCGLTVLDVS